MNTTKTAIVCFAVIVLAYFAWRIYVNNYKHEENMDDLQDDWHRLLAEQSNKNEKYYL